MLPNPTTQFSAVIKGNIEGLDQGITLLSMITNEQYCICAKPYIACSIGEHLRHVLDLYYAVKNSMEMNLIDYDSRNRGALVESCRVTGLLELQKIKAWMLALQPYTIEDKILMATEISVAKTLVVQVETSLLRELIFVRTHAIHHYALMNISAKLCNFEIPENMGLAPTTVTALRNNSSCVQ